MSLAQHLLELRKRLFRSALAVVIGSIAGWIIAEFVLQAMRAPISQIAESEGRLAALNFDNLTGAFDLRIQIAVTVGIVISSPVWLYQFFAFLVPGLSSKEKRYTFGFLFTAVPLFFSGCAAGWFVIPHIVTVLAGFAPAESSSLIQANNYFDFILKLVVAVGVAFVLPVFIVLLNFIGVISAESIRKSWRIALLGVFIFAALVTPSADVLSMFLLAIPMMGLYFAAAGVAAIHDRRIRRAEIKANASADIIAGVRGTP